VTVYNEEGSFSSPDDGRQQKEGTAPKLTTAMITTPLCPSPSSNHYSPISLPCPSPIHNYSPQ